MLPVADALEIVLHHARPRPAESSSLAAAPFGSVLGEDVASDIDMPPFDKALMDGYAVRCADLKDGAAELLLQAEVTAGQTPPALEPCHTIRIMTGAPIPAGADAVVKVEHTRGLPDDYVEIRTKQPKPGKFILTRGSEIKVGEVVLACGTVLGPQHLGLLASMGRSTFKVIPRPNCSILATGDELVSSDSRPGPAQLRNSNGPMLVAQATRAGAVVHDLGIARDNVDELRARIGEGLRSSILVLSGGVSAGKLDLVPGVLKDLDVQPHFHHVAMKPGKPLFFGSRGSTLVFGLPGNPVSSFCGFELFVRPAIRKLNGQRNPGPDWLRAELAEDFPYHTDRPTYHPARLESVAGLNRVRTVPWFGSPDLRALARANALLLLPAGEHVHAAGTMMSVLPLD